MFEAGTRTLSKIISAWSPSWPKTALRPETTNGRGQNNRSNRKGPEGEFTQELPRAGWVSMLPVQ